jgi:hypothetical protein
MTDTDGCLLAVEVHAADIQDRNGAKGVLKRSRRSFPFVKTVFADGGYAGCLVKWAKDKSVFEKPMCGSLSGEADGRAMIAKASIPPRTDDHADERCRIAMRAEATAGLLKRPQRQTSRWRSSGACHG